MTGHLRIQLLLLISPFRLMALQTVNCPSDAVAPTPPAVTDAGGRAITPTVTSPSPVTCNGTMVYTFTYADCAGHTHDWTYTYTMLLPSDFTLPVNGSSTVNCPSDAVAPTPPAVTDACGRAITPTVTTPSPVTCKRYDGIYIYLCRLCRPHS
jgi:hypothetical protein